MHLDLLCMASQAIMEEVDLPWGYGHSPLNTSFGQLVPGHAEQSTSSVLATSRLVCSCCKHAGLLLIHSTRGAQRKGREIAHILYEYDQKPDRVLMKGLAGNQKTGMRVQGNQICFTLCHQG